MIDASKVTRLEVIDSKGRAYVGIGVHVTGISYQDNGQTMKIFVEDDPELKKTVIEKMKEGMRKFSQDLLLNIK